MPIKTIIFALFLTPALIMASGCSSSGTPLIHESDNGRPAAASASRIDACKNTDWQVSSADQCLQDDAACYPISNGQWCTGERGNTCPAGSTTLAAGSACPYGARCFQFSESLHCAIN